MRECVAIIPAKGHSRRLPGKNLRLCAGKTLVERAVECALEAGIFSSIVVSSESEEILSQAYDIGVIVHPRESLLSADGVSVAAVVALMLGRLSVFRDSLCVLWPTTPTRTPEVLRAMWERFEGEHFDSLHSVYAGFPLRHDGTAIFMRTLEFLKRLSLDYRFGNAFHVVANSVDVNTAEDLARAEAIILAREAACPSNS